MLQGCGHEKLILELAPCAVSKVLGHYTMYNVDGGLLLPSLHSFSELGLLPPQILDPALAGA